MRSMSVSRCPLVARLAILSGVALATLVLHGAHATDRPASVELTPTAVVLQKDGLRLPVSLVCPKFVVDGTQVGGKELPVHTSGRVQAGETLEMPFQPIALGDSSRLEVTLHLSWSATESVLRKWAEFCLADASRPKLLSEVVLEELDTAANGTKLLAQQPVNVDGIQSHPVFLQGFFVGIEHPVASCRAQKGRVVLSHLPGLTIEPGKKYRTRKAVFGIAEAGREKQAFRRYVEANRPMPKGRHHFVYNPFWSTPTVPSRNDILELMATLRTQAYQPHRITFDSCGLTVFTTDTKSIWEVDKKRFPQGLVDLQEACRSIGSHLDLFFSPSSCYPPALDPVWAKQKGYETFELGSEQRLCLAGKRYQSQAKKAITDTVARYDVSHVFVDGYVFQCPARDHGHEPGVLSAEPIADGLIDILDALRKVSPGVWLAPTCFGWNPSPWWCFHVNSVIGTYGDDAPYGRVPSPVYRESYTSARDYYNLQGAYWLSAPICATESFGIIHQSNYPLMNDAVTDLLRGNMEQHTAVNPSYMNDLRWGQLAQLMTWARRNVEILWETEPLLPASWQNGKCPKITNDATMPREPYGYAHWGDGSGLVLLRNPWIELQSYSFNLAVSGNQALKPGSLSAVSIYPEVRVYGRDLEPGATLKVRLAPYETVVLSIDRGQLPPGLPEASRAVCSQLKAKVLRSEASLVKYDTGPVALGADSTSLVGSVASSVRVELDAEVIADAPQSEFLVLIEDTDAPIDALCHVHVNGKESAILSGGSETGWAASGLARPERWLFLSSALSPGKNLVSVKLLTRGGKPTVSAWAWAKRKGSHHAGSHSNTIPQPRGHLPGRCQPVEARERGDGGSIDQG